MIKEVKNYKRKDLFIYYNDADNPFVIVNVPIKVTNIVNYCKINKYFYATMGYIICKTANDIEEFKYRYENGTIYYCDNVNASYSEIRKDGNVGFFSVKQCVNYKEYINRFKEEREKLLNDEKYQIVNKLDDIWISCAPWFSFNSLVIPINKKYVIPQFIWDKYKIEKDDYYINLMIMIHHGFADGYHIGKFISLLEKNLEEFNG